MRRPHRRVHHPGTKCKCPKGARPVSTCNKTTGQCKGRRMGCIAMVVTAKSPKPMPRFVRMDCGPEAGPIEQWRPKKGKSYRRAKQLKLKLDEPPRRTRTREDDDYTLPFTF